MSKNDPKINFYYGQEDLQNIIKHVIRHKLNSYDRKINENIFNEVTSNINNLKEEKE